MSFKQGFRKIRSWISFSSSSHIDYSAPHPSSAENLPAVPTSSAKSSRKDLDTTDGARSPPRSSVPIPENETYALSSLDTHCALALSELTKEIAPIPTIGSLVGCLKHMFQAIERSKVNKGQWKLLRGRCVMVLRIAGAHVENYGQECYPNLEEAAALLQNALNRVEERAQHYNEMNGLLALALSQSISDDIRILFAYLDDCLRLFNFTVEFAHEQWSGQYQSIRRRESSELRRLRGELEKMNINFDVLRQNPDESFQKANSTPQQALDGKYTIFRNQATITAASYVDAQHLVHTILSVTGLQLPPKVILGKRCILDAPTPIKTGITCDIYQASFFSGGEVTKDLGIEIFDNDYMGRYATRFLRIASLWSESRSDFNFPFCGMGVRLNSLGGESHLQLYTASPLIKSFEQNKENRSIKKNILRTITDTAKGLRYLHDRRTPITHSGMRDDNIFVTDSEGGILGRFGLNKAIESVGNDKLSPALMTGNSESQEWMAPKISMNDPPLETMCDVWGWATMAALKIVGGSIPLHAHKQAISVIIQIGEGPPCREHHPKFEEYAYRPDEMWELLQKCWAIERSDRPTIDEIILRLKDIAKMPEVGV
ncbi:Macrophage colony-stimulating factor 1 receptor 2 [Rhizoctonia solani]|uniref:Macrophage colony-stimulating factor 1 receptor 2 n=1 Tax=Rhizoctonia solani TaxID=456999 RepID=A0A0K6G9K8_9AGAM|nr:Macrophage colony-stimulating factor 1 receptor 2 [Rhizoctonia solani]